ncbi:hypothetical protein ACFW3D_26970 [Streptomyces sp. NPDC058864]
MRQYATQHRSCRCGDHHFGRTGDSRRELTHRGGSAEAQAAARAAAEQIPASAIADAIAFAINQPANVDVNELIVRPTAQG